MRTTAILLMTLVATGVSAQQTPTTGYAPVNGLNMYYEVDGGGEPVVLLHGAFMTITNNWDGWIGALSKTRKVSAIEMQGHGRTSESSPRPRKRTTSEPTSLRPPRRPCCSSTATLTACGSRTSRRCFA